jgi:hypothetical protein
VVVHSSLHSQNATLCDFFYQEPDFPIPLTPNDNYMMSLLRLSRDEIFHRVSISNSGQSGSKTPYEVDKLLISIVDISKSSLCAVSDVSVHILRVILQLWKVIVSGTGEPDLAWANPAAIIPLRVHAFATLLQLLGSSTLYFSKRGVTQLDGGNKWNLVSMSRMIALIFDEGKLFGKQAKESFSFNPEALFSAGDQKVSVAQSERPEKRVPKEKRRRHVRSNFEFFNNVSQLSGSAEGVDKRSPEEVTEFLFGNASSSSSLLGENLKELRDKDFQFHSRTLPHSLRATKHSDETTNVDVVGPGDLSGVSNPDTGNIKMDSASDFRSALEAGNLEAGNDAMYEGPTNGGASAAIAMIKAFSGTPMGSRRWMTAPTPGLATIREDADGDNSGRGALSISKNSPPKKSQGPLDSLDTELFLRPSGSSVKQMRVPKVNKSGASIEVKAPPSIEKTDSEENSKASLKSLPGSDEEIESAGTAFLDVIGRSLGLR